MAQQMSLDVNGHAARVTVDDPETPLLYVLRDDLGLHGPRFGCGLGQCGSCTVHIDGQAVRSCITPVSGLKPGAKIVTL
ncbi:2Fe-2S iron-sulfur cluster-binding protein, partial [Acinetobacter baumannii]